MRKFTQVFSVLYIVFGGLLLSESIIAVSRTKPVEVLCSSTVRAAGWHEIVGGPDARFSLTTNGMEVKGEGLVFKWDNLEEGIFHDGDSPYVIAKCLPSEKELKMYDLPDEFPYTPPTLVCAKGESIAIRFLSPNDPDPERYIYKATLTVDRDEDADRLSGTPVKVGAGDQVPSANSSPEGSLSGSEASDGTPGRTTTPTETPLNGLMSTGNGREKTHSVGSFVSGILERLTLKKHIKHIDPAAVHGLVGSQVVRSY